jgi:hypothetical protein
MATHRDFERLVAKFCKHLDRIPLEYRTDVMACVETVFEVVDVKWLQLFPRTTTPEDTLREAGISSKRQAKHQRRMSSLPAGRA